MSDIHFTKGTSNVSSFDIDRIVRNELVRDAVNLLPSVQPLSGIIISGDIAFAGKPEEFQTGIGWLAELSEKLNCDPSFVWCVPGNHDVDRNVIREHTGITPIQNDIRNSTDLHSCMKKHLTGGDAALLFEPLRGYNDSIGQRFLACVPKRVALRSVLRRYSNALPWKSLVPDWVVSEITPDAVPPYCGP